MDENVAGRWIDGPPGYGPVWVKGKAVTHTEATTDAGPNYCRECTEAAGYWVKWPCEGGQR